MIQRANYVSPVSHRVENVHEIGFVLQCGWQKFVLFAENDYLIYQKLFVAEPRDGSDENQMFPSHQCLDIHAAWIM